MTERTSRTLQEWLVTLSIIFTSFFGFLSTLICIFALPGGKSLPLEASYFFLGSSMVLVAFLLLHSKRNNDVTVPCNDLHPAVKKEGMSGKLMKWFIAIYSVFYIFCGLILTLICIYSLPDQTVQPKVGVTYFFGGVAVLVALVLSVFCSGSRRK